MKIIFIYFVILLLSTFLSSTYYANAQQLGYITLEGRQFKDQAGNDFYPIVCCYGVKPVYTTPGNYYLSPINAYGGGISCPNCRPLPNYEFECDNQIDCLVDIHNDFLKIIDMGFNTIRLYEIGIHKIDRDKQGIIGFLFTAIENKHPIDWGYKEEQIEITPIPYNYDDPLNSNCQLLFGFYDLILNEAAQCGLKVIIDIAYDELAAHSVNVDDYANYLSALANHLTNRTSLMAYITIHEPSLNQYNIGHTKKEICEMTTLWYDAIKSRDANHLITNGGNDLFDIFEWDPGAMKLDFYSPHIYPDKTPYELFKFPSALERVRANLYYLGKNCPLPFMIGETGFSAMDDNPNGGSAILNFPEVDGSITEQDNFMQEMFSAVRNSNGSGISVWNYQQHWWGANEPRQNGYGILRHGGILDINGNFNFQIDKPVVNFIRNYPNPPPIPVAPFQPANYYNLKNYLSGPDDVFGNVWDVETYNTIPNAIVQGWLNYYIFNTTTNRWILKSDNNHTFTDVNGQFVLNSVYPLAMQSPLLPGLVDLYQVWVTAPSYETAKQFRGNGYPLDYFIHSSPFNYNLDVTNEMVNIGNSTRRYRAWNSLEVYNLHVQATGSIQLIAGNKVHLNYGFQSKFGSETHVFCSTQPFSLCDEDMLNQRNSTNAYQSGNYFDQPNKTLELTINKNTSYLEIFPNPNKGTFNVRFSSTAFKNGTVKNICIVSPLGDIIYKEDIQSNTHSMNITDIAPGIYFIRISDGFTLLHNRLIIQE